ncbi:MAG: 2-C-methyl-D-erythritol 4-phosphate cytidylyltransferase [Bacteroidota bacterium]
MQHTALLMPAAGKGLRLGGPRKQFRHLGGAPVWIQTLRTFDRHPDVTHLVVACPVDDVSDMQEAVEASAIKTPCTVVAGGATRQASVQHALDAAPAGTDIVLVHDAVRPFVTQSGISAVIDAVRREGAGALAIPVADTLRAGTDGTFESTIPRAGLYRMQTPQGFRTAWLRTALERAPDNLATDDVGLVQAAGYPVRIVPGSALNFKITTPEDWRLAERLFG